MPNGNIEDKEELRKKLKILLAKVWALLNSDEFDLDNKEHSKLWTDMVNTAVKLHKIVQPKHHKYMLENRGVPPDDPEFYNHIHPIEDLLAYMDNPHANDDPEDQTIGHEFKIRVFSRRWGHYDVYTMKRTINGWYISFVLIEGDCDKKGVPYLYKNLDHDSINYPEELPGYVEYLWEQAHEKGLNHDEVQQACDELAEWVSICEKNSPEGIWKYYK